MRKGFWLATAVLAIGALLFGATGALADEEDRVVGNNDKVDRLEVVAVNLDTGEECRGAVQGPL